METSRLEITTALVSIMLGVRNMVQELGTEYTEVKMFDLIRNALTANELCI